MPAKEGMPCPFFDRRGGAAALRATPPPAPTLRGAPRAGGPPAPARPPPPAAHVRVPAEALRPAAAEAGETGHHVVARPQRGHLLADRLDDAGAPVAAEGPA